MCMHVMAKRLSFLPGRRAGVAHGWQAITQWAASERGAGGSAALGHRHADVGIARRACQLAGVGGPVRRFIDWAEIECHEQVDDDKDQQRRDHHPDNDAGNNRECFGR